MSKNRIALYLGIFLVILTFLGIPSSWKVCLSALSGLALIGLSFSVPNQNKTVNRMPRKKREIKQPQADNLAPPISLQQEEADRTATKTVNEEKETI